MNSTCPTQSQSQDAQCDHIPPARVGAHVGHNLTKVILNKEVTQTFGFALGARDFLDTKILVLVTGNAHDWGPAKCNAPTYMGL